VWRELADNNAIIPLAAERNLAVKVSNDPKEGAISFPLRPIGAGTDDMLMTHLILMMKTSEVKDAGTGSNIRLKIMNGKEVLVDYTIPDTPQADHETGQANFYKIRLEKSFSKTMLQAKSIRFINNGFDSWLPKSCFLFGFNQKARRSESLVTLVHLFEWSSGWLSSDQIDNARKSVVLPLFSQDNPRNGNGKRESTQQVKAEEKQVNNKKQQEVKAGKKQVNNKKQQQVKAEVVSQQQSNHTHSQTVKSQKEGKWVSFENMKSTKQVKNQQEKSNKTSVVANKSHKGKEKTMATHYQGQYSHSHTNSKNGSQHTQNGYNKTSSVVRPPQTCLPKVSKSNGRQQTQGEWVWIEAPSTTQEQVTTIQTAELVPA